MFTGKNRLLSGLLRRFPPASAARQREIDLVLVWRLDRWRWSVLRMPVPRYEVTEKPLCRSPGPSQRGNNALASVQGLIIRDSWEPKRKFRLTDGPNRHPEFQLRSGQALRSGGNHSACYGTYRSFLLVIEPILLDPEAQWTSSQYRSFSFPSIETFHCRTTKASMLQQWIYVQRCRIRS